MEPFIFCPMELSNEKINEEADMANEVDPSLNTISNDQYGFMQAFMKLAEKCFPQVPDTTEDTTKTGMFGYLTEIAAHSAKSSQFHRTLLYNEFFLNTAMMPSTVYNKAESEGVELKASRPSSCTLVLEIEKTKLLNLIDSSVNGWLEINREDFLVSLDETQFRLPFSLVFSRNANGIRGLYKSVPINDGTRTFTAEVPLFDTEYDFRSNFAVPIKEYFDPTKNASMVSFSILAFNVVFMYHEDTYADSSNSSISKYMIDFDKKYVSATAFEKSNQEDSWSQIETVTSALKTVSETSHSVYLKRLDDNTVLFYFGRGERSYVPANGTILRFIVATTDGETGNFTFRGTPAISIDKVDFASEFSAWVFSSPAGGSDEDSLMTHKKDIYTNRTKAKLLGSENDLNEFFASTSVGNEKTKVLVFKKRDDLINREFNAFAMLSDDTCTYETNTIPYVNIDSVVEEEKEGYKVKKISPYMPIRYTLPYSANHEQEDFFLKGTVIDLRDPIENIKELLLNRNEFIYFSPYTYYVKTSSTSLTTVNIYDEHVNETYSVYIKTLTTESIDTPIVNYAKAKRNPALSNIINTYVYVTESETSHNKYFLMLKNTEDVLVAIELNKNYDENCYEIGLYTGEISVDDYKKYSIGVQPYDTNTCKMFITRTSEDDPRWVSVGADESVNFRDITEAYIYCLEPVDTNNLIPDNKSSYEELVGINSAYLGYRLKSISTINGGFKFFENMNDVMSVDADTVKSTLETNTTNIEMMPVVGGRLLYSNSVYESFMALERSVVESIRSAAKRLHNNTRLNVKFFNTYGRTDFWRGQALSSSNEENVSQNLLKPNLFYEVIVDRPNGYDEDIEKGISKIIRTWTETLFDMVYNDVLITERISLSNLLKELESKITDCDSINIKAVNEINHLKYIVPIKDYKVLLSGESHERSSAYFVPSFPTVNLGVLNESRSLKKENDILIQFVS